MFKPKPDCRTCGLCCVSLIDQEVLCNLELEDVERLGPALRRKHVKYIFVKGFQPALATKWTKNRCGPLKGAETCNCALLGGSVLHAVYCRIYSIRPQVCHKAMRPGEQACHQLRRLVQDGLQQDKEQL